MQQDDPGMLDDRGFLFRMPYSQEIYNFDFEKDPNKDLYMKTKDENTLIEIFSGKDWQAEMVKNILENEGIESFLKDEIMGSLYPPNAVGDTKVMISSLDYYKAKILVDKYENR
jgi:hypothetical protein